MNRKILTVVFLVSFLCLLLSIVAIFIISFTSLLPKDISILVVQYLFGIMFVFTASYYLSGIKIKCSSCGFRLITFANKDVNHKSTSWNTILACVLFKKPLKCSSCNFDNDLNE